MKFYSGNSRHRSIPRSTKVGALALATVAGVMLAAAPASASPFDQRPNNYKTVSKHPWNNYWVLLNKRTCAMMVRRGLPLNSSTKSRYIRARFNTRHVLEDGTRIHCKGNRGNCIDWRVKKVGGPVTYHVSKPHFLKGLMGPEAAYWRTALRCTPGTQSAPTGTQWIYRGGTPGNAGSITISDANQTAPMKDTYHYKGRSRVLKATAACRVIHWGATFLGEVTTAPGHVSKAWVLRGHGFKYEPLGSGSRQVCQVNLGAANDRYYFNFEVLKGSISGSRWKAWRSGKRPPRFGTAVGTLDNSSVFLCTQRHVYEKTHADEGLPERTYVRRLGWWKPFTSTCHVPQRPASGASPGPQLAVYRRILTNR